MGRGGGGGGRRREEIKQHQKQRLTFQIFLSECRVYGKSQISSIIREITDINLGSRRYGSKSGDYKHKYGDREIQFKIWRLPDYPGELTALLTVYLGICQVWCLYSKLDEYLLDLMYSRANLDMCI